MKSFDTSAEHDMGGICREDKTPGFFLREKLARNEFGAEFAQVYAQNPAEAQQKSKFLQPPINHVTGAMETNIPFSAYRANVRKVLDLRF